VCVRGGGDKRRGLRRAIKRKNMRREEGVIFRYSRVCAESRAVEISNWPPHFPVASLPLNIWSAGDYWKILGV